jgi:hypothetical protein
MSNIAAIDPPWGDAGRVNGRLAPRTDCVCRSQDTGRSGDTNCVACPL